MLSLLKNPWFISLGFYFALILIFDVDVLFTSLCWCAWAAIVVVYLLFVLHFSKIHGCLVLCRLAVAILACFTARRWRLVELTVASWRLAALLKGPSGGPCFSLFFTFFFGFSFDCCLGCETPMLQLFLHMNDSLFCCSSLVFRYTINSFFDWIYHSNANFKLPLCSNAYFAYDILLQSQKNEDRRWQPFKRAKMKGDNLLSLLPQKR